MFTISDPLFSRFLCPTWHVKFSLQNQRSGALWKFVYAVIGRFFSPHCIVTMLLYIHIVCLQSFYLTMLFGMQQPPFVLGPRGEKVNLTMWLFRILIDFSILDEQKHSLDSEIRNIDTSLFAKTFRVGGFNSLCLFICFCNKLYYIFGELQLSVCPIEVLLSSRLIDSPTCLTVEMSPPS